LNAADMTALVSYLSSLGGTSAGSAAAPSGSSSTVPAQAEPDAKAEPSKLNGEAIFKAHKCDSCHGTNGVGGTAPRIAGQNSSYLANQLLRFRAGDRAPASEMTSIAKQLDGEQIRAVAAFLASQ
jgi:cytochrome c553